MRPAGYATTRARTDTPVPARLRCAHVTRNPPAPPFTSALYTTRGFSAKRAKASLGRKIENRAPSALPALSTKVPQIPSYPDTTRYTSVVGSYATSLVSEGVDGRKPQLVLTGHVGPAVETWAHAGVPAPWIASRATPAASDGLNRMPAQTQEPSQR